ncbi:glycosyltransferase [Kineothrix sp. MSJ-39]|uniref:glycosyltransferase n=1 Tax=Kineothrix sp. MSJ-39 TaxID=2841533 RepID=UPI001C122154|nr:glycosyltransferase [Kineothrix sp. MSJ-39]MBU5429197.1 glycosyltransferase [Kineothrix sp. MSJ-39]
MSVYQKEQPAYLKESIDSLLAQTILPEQIVIVCDGELTQALYEVLDMFEVLHPALFTRVQLTKQGGLGNALNEGMKYCRCETIARMDSDDISCPDRMEKELALLSEQKADLVSGSVAEFETDPAVIGKIRILPRTQAEILRFARRRNPFNHPCVMYKKSMVLRAGGYQPFEGFEDYYLWLRMLKCGAVGYNTEQVLLYMRTKGMYRRRGGLVYAGRILRFRNYMLKNGYCGLGDYLFTVCGHVGVSLLPDGLRHLFYDKVLRKD